MMNSEPVLIVDDEQSLRGILSSLLAENGCRTISAASAEEALEKMNGTAFSAALVDIKLPGMSGLHLLEEIKRVSPSTEVILMTSYASLDTAVEAIRKGAYDYLQKPFDDLEDAWRTVRRALEKRYLSLNNAALVRDLEGKNRELSDAVKRQNALVNAGRAMSGISALSELLDFFIGVVAEELGVDRASLMLLDEKTGEITIAASRGLNDEVVKKVRLKIGEGIAGWVAKEGKPILVKDVETDPRVKNNLKSTLSNSFISAPIVLSIPILLQEKVLGVINITNRVAGDPFDENDMAFLYSLAGQAAVAIERTRQLEELQAAYESVKTAQQRLLDTERLKAVGQMAAGVAHDFNNLLTGILGRTQLLQLKLRSSKSDPSSITSELEVIEKIALQGAAAVRRIQDFSRIRKDAPGGVIDLNLVVKNALEMTRIVWKDEYEAKGTRIDIHLELENLPLTTGNESDLTQVVSNLIFNAVEAMPGGGDLTLKTFSDGKDIYLEVSDTGIGMSKEVQERMFEPFFTTKECGQGLGTSIVYGIVARHNGQIKVSSFEGSGTTFQLLLPVASEPEAGTPAEPNRSRKVAKASRVLVIDDGEINRDLFESFLRSMGHKAILATNGKEGIETFERGKIDLVITDLSMPGISGWQVVDRVKKSNPQVPVILVSGWAIQQDEPRIRESGVDYILQKPCPMQKFQEAVEEALGSRPGVDAV